MRSGCSSVLFITSRCRPKKRVEENGIADDKYFLTALASMFIAGTALAQDYDLVILNGRVIDPETGFDQVSNVGVKGGEIAVITTESIDGDEAINAEGLIVAPGFIDLHAHGQNIGDYRMQAMQGVTTMLELESGVLPVVRLV